MMMDFLSHFFSGFQVALNPMNLMYCFVGAALGTLIGVLPGIGPGPTIALLLPITFRLTPIEATIMIAGIYYGAMYGGSTTSILVNIPGEAASVVTCIDGYQMARKGRAGPALGISAFGSFIGGTLSVVGLMFLATPLASVAIKFGPPEYFSLMCLGLTLVIYLAQKDMAKSLIMASFGLALGTIGMDLETGEVRFGLGIKELYDGVGLVPLLMGLFGISEVIINLEKEIRRDLVESKIRFKNLLPTLKDWGDSKMAIGRGTLIGFLLGILPGGGAIIASFVSYAMEKRFSDHPEKFGTGAIEGVAGPETANNAASGGAFIPLFVLGIPANVVMALLLSSLMIHGLQPGPTLIQMHPDLFWGTVASMYIGNVMCLAFNLPMIGIWVQLLRVPYKILFPLIILFCTIGAYSMNNSVFEIFIMLFFGVLGYFLRKWDYEMAPLVLAFVLGPMLENALRQSLAMSQGKFAIFFTRPISAVALGIVLVSLLTSAVPKISRLRNKVTRESDGDI
jgi:putative tricarboxylic transport membrane protein